MSFCCQQCRKPICSCRDGLLRQMAGSVCYTQTRDKHCSKCLCEQLGMPLRGYKRAIFRLREKFRVSCIQGNVSYIYGIMKTRTTPLHSQPCMIVQQVRMASMRDWYYSTTQSIRKDYFPSYKPAGMNFIKQLKD